MSKGIKKTFIASVQWNNDICKGLQSYLNYNHDFYLYLLTNNGIVAINVDATIEIILEFQGHKLHFGE